MGTKTTISQDCSLVIGHGNSYTGVTLMTNLATEPGWQGGRPAIVPQLGQQGPGATDGRRQAPAAPAVALAGTSEKSGGRSSWSRGQLQGL